jgi:hypothetical protein
LHLVDWSFGRKKETRERNDIRETYWRIARVGFSADDNDAVHSGIDFGDL